MAPTLTKEQMFQRILDEDARKLDLVADTRRMSAIVAPTIEGGRNEVVIDVDRRDGPVESLVLNDHARGQIATDLGIPKKYFDRMLETAPTLLKSNVNHWLFHDEKRRLVRGFKPSEGEKYGTARAFLSDRYKRMDNIQIAKKIFPVFDEIPGLTFHQAQLTDTRFYLRAYLPGLEVDLKPGQTWSYKGEAVVGDIVRAGLEIRNSEVGNGLLSIQPFLLRLICTNGMTVNDYATKRRHVGGRIEEQDETFYAADTLAADDEAFWLRARDEVKAALSDVRFAEIAQRLGEIVHGEKIQAPIVATTELQQRFSLTEEERDSVLRNLVEAGDLSQWGLLNAVTAAAKEADDFDRQADLEALGWDVASMTAREFEKLAVA
jgi:hypothetical protein